MYLKKFFHAFPSNLKSLNTDSLQIKDGKVIRSSQTSSSEAWQSARAPCLAHIRSLWKTCGSISTTGNYAAIIFSKVRNDNLKECDRVPGAELSVSTPDK